MSECPICFAKVAPSLQALHAEWHRQLRMRGAEPLAPKYFVEPPPSPPAPVPRKET